MSSTFNVTRFACVAKEYLTISRAHSRHIRHLEEVREQSLRRDLQCNKRILFNTKVASNTCMYHGILYTSTDTVGHDLFDDEHKSLLGEEETLSHRGALIIFYFLESHR